MCPPDSQHTCDLGISVHLIDWLQQLVKCDSMGLTDQQASAVIAAINLDIANLRDSAHYPGLTLSSKGIDAKYTTSAMRRCLMMVLPPILHGKVDHEAWTGVEEVFAGRCLAESFTCTPQIAML
jgi:hypothetical protein